MSINNISGLPSTRIDTTQCFLTHSLKCKQLQHYINLVDPICITADAYDSRPNICIICNICIKQKLCRKQNLERGIYADICGSIHSGEMSHRQLELGEADCMRELLRMVTLEWQQYGFSVHPRRDVPTYFFFV